MTNIKLSARRRAQSKRSRAVNAEGLSRLDKLGLLAEPLSREERETANRNKIMLTGNTFYDREQVRFYQEMEQKSEERKCKGQPALSALESIRGMVSFEKLVELSKNDDWLAHQIGVNNDYENTI